MHAGPQQKWKDCRTCLEDCRIQDRLDDAHFFHVPMRRAPLPPDCDSVRYVLVAQEPATGVGRTRAVREAKFSEGWTNFFSTAGDFTLQFAVENYLLERGEGYYLTNLGKCALPTQTGDGRRPADETRARRYANCASYLAAEIAHFRGLRAIIAVGPLTRIYLDGFARPGWPMIHDVAHHAPRVLRTSPTGVPALLRSLRSFAAVRREDVGSPPQHLPTFTSKHAALARRYEEQLGDIQRHIRRG